jgi:hypothetical protein
VAGHEEFPLIGWGAATLLSLVLGVPQPAAPAGGVFYVQIVREQLSVRVPVRIRQITPAARNYRWKESKGPDCLPARAIAGAALLSENSVDLIMRDRRRFRAKLDTKCPELDYYSGFYINATVDGLVCADRDIIRSRVGGQCEIERFRALQAMPRDDD